MLKFKIISCQDNRRQLLANKIKTMACAFFCVENQRRRADVKQLKQEHIMQKLLRYYTLNMKKSPLIVIGSRINCELGFVLMTENMIAHRETEDDIRRLFALFSCRTCSDVSVGNSEPWRKKKVFI